MSRRWGRLELKSGDRAEFRVVDASLARALYLGIPAARLLARVRLGHDEGDPPSAWDERMRELLGDSADGVKRAMARHARVALDEGPLQEAPGTFAVLAWAVASAPDTDASLAEIAPAGGEPSTCEPSALLACAAYDARLSDPSADKRAPAFEACVRLASRACLGPITWDRVLAIAAQLERIELGVRLLGNAPGSIFPRRVDDEIAASDRCMAAIDRAGLDALVAKDPRQLAALLGRTDHAAGGSGAQLATFLADLGRILKHEGTLVAALAPVDPHAGQSDATAARGGSSPEWNATTVAAMAEAIERGATSLPRVRAAAARGGEAALDAIGEEMLQVDGHESASAVFAEVLSQSRRPRDVLRLVTYFAIAPDPVLAARALGACSAAELPRVLGAWLDAMLPVDGEDAAEASSARVTACIASLKPYPQLYSAVRPILARLDLEPLSG